jgi:dTDP-4-dehydrorhamnose reductase
VDATDGASLAQALDRSRPEVVVNCVGLIKQRPDGQDPEQTILANSLVPHRLARLCAEREARLVQISTDCVFSGTTGGYTEESVPDATDFYGRSKLLGEVTDGDAVTLRTSIIGPEIGHGLGLVAWFLRQSGSVTGYRKAIFSGVPTVELARIIRDHVLPSPDLQGLFHVSADAIAKHDLLALVRDAYRSDVELVADDGVRIDRSLDSAKFRARTGYVPPPWPALVAKMKAFG